VGRVRSYHADNINEDENNARTINEARFEVYHTQKLRGVIAKKLVQIRNTPWVTTDVYQRHLVGSKRPYPLIAFLIDEYVLSSKNVGD